MKTKCTYPDCACEINLGYCDVTGRLLDDYEGPPLRQPTIGERAMNVMRPGLGMIVLGWRWLTGGGRR